MDVTVCVATFGGPEWIKLAERAIASAEPQAPVMHVHADTLANARNQALAAVTTPAVIFLDADDELEPGYVATLQDGTADLRAPSVRYVRGRSKFAPHVPKVAGHQHDCTAECIRSGAGNWLVVGTMAPAQLLRDVGGWREWPCYEDFDLWMRAICAGATVEAIPGAVYRAAWRADSRNRAPSVLEKNRVHHAIVAANIPDGLAA